MVVSRVMEWVRVVMECGCYLSAKRDWCTLRGCFWQSGNLAIWQLPYICQIAKIPTHPQEIVSGNSLSLRYCQIARLPKSQHTQQMVSGNLAIWQLPYICQIARNSRDRAIREFSFFLLLHDCPIARKMEQRNITSTSRESE
jgi:hypothetical protein